MKYIGTDILDPLEHQNFAFQLLSRIKTSLNYQEIWIAVVDDDGSPVGNATVRWDGKITRTDCSGFAKITISGNTTVIAERENYTVATRRINARITGAELDVFVEPATAVVGEDWTAVVRVERDGSPVENASVVAYAGGIRGTGRTGADGVARVPMGAIHSPGVYNVSVEVIISGAWGNVSTLAAGLVIVKRGRANITVSVPREVAIGERVELEITGNARTYNVTVGDMSFEAVSENGTARITFVADRLGVLPVVVRAEYPWEGEWTGNITVKCTEALIEIEMPSRTHRGEVDVVRVRVKTGDKYVPGANIGLVLYIDGEAVARGVTDSVGKCNIRFNNMLQAGTHVATVGVAPGSYGIEGNSSVEFDVIERTSVRIDYTFANFLHTHVFNEPEWITTTIMDEDGVPLSDVGNHTTNRTVIITINGEVHVVKSGEAVRYSPRVDNEIRVEYLGDRYYDPCVREERFVAVPRCVSVQAILHRNSHPEMNAEKPRLQFFPIAEGITYPQISLVARAGFEPASPA